MLHNELLELADHLLRTAGPRRPRQVFLRRAVSCVYYAVFHALALMAADLLVGGRAAHRSKAAWTQVYRSLEHRRAHELSRAALMASFPEGLQRVANTFVI